jgi:hypothetical protein
VKETKTQTSKKEGKESKDPDTTRSKREGRGNSGVSGGESAKERKMMARFRYGSEERENRYWIEGEERGCRMYYERETIEHM